MPYESESRHKFFHANKKKLETRVGCKRIIYLREIGSPKSSSGCSTLEKGE